MLSNHNIKPILKRNNVYDSFEIIIAFMRDGLHEEGRLFLLYLEVIKIDPPYEK